MIIIYFGLITIAERLIIPRIFLIGKFDYYAPVLDEMIHNKSISIQESKGKLNRYIERYSNDIGFI